jgi:hypothetical protein
MASSLLDKKMIEAGLSASAMNMCAEDRVWSRYSHDKVDIGEELAKVIRTLSKELPLSKPIRALSVGSSAEPQFRILETACRGGLYLFDIDKGALNIIKERIRRQRTSHVVTIEGDYNRVFLNAGHTRSFLKDKLDGQAVNLISLHHSLYYSKESDWLTIFANLYKRILAGKGAIHAVLMASETKDEYTSTWLYNHFAGKFFGCHNDQDLLRFGRRLSSSPVFTKAQVLGDTHRVSFFVDDFRKFMSVIWMILLYPNVHKYTLRQREEITEHVYKKFWLKKRPLIQMQDHLVVYKGIGFEGLI